MDDHLWDLAQAGPQTGRSPGARSRRERSRTYLGRRLRAWRRAEGLTQSAAHRRLELHGNRYRAGKLETGELPWQRYEVEALADAVGVDVDDLLRQAIQAADPDAERRRADVIAYALTLEREAWNRLVAEVDARRRT